MGMFSGLFRSRDKPQNRTAGSAYTFYMGGTSSGKAVTERSAMQMTAVYSCVRIRSNGSLGHTHQICQLLLGQARHFTRPFNLVGKSHIYLLHRIFTFVTSSTSSELLTKLHRSAINLNAE